MTTRFLEGRLVIPIVATFLLIPYTCCCSSMGHLYVCLITDITLYAWYRGVDDVPHVCIVLCVSKQSVYKQHQLDPVYRHTHTAHATQVYKL
jgi:hypothetical protein